MDEPDRSSDEHPASPDDAPSHSPQLRVETVDATRRLKAAERAWLADRLTDTAAELTRRFNARGELRVRIVDDAEMSAAHKRWSGDPTTTDVLTFELSDTAGVLDTDLLACLDEAQRQATIHGHDRVRELLLYALHGALHCLGHDDHDDESYQAMHAAEDAVLQAIGVGKTFEPGASA